MKEQQDDKNSTNVENYGWAAVTAPDSCEYLAPQIKAILAAINSRRVLDLGSGNGRLCCEMKDAGYDVVGTEYDQSGWAISQAAYPGIRFYNLGVGDDPVLLTQEQGRFDAVVSTEVVEHLYSPHHLPQFARGVLRENGYLIISTPYHGFLKNLLLSIFNKWDSHLNPLWHGGHIKMWSRVTLSRLLEAQGFSVVGFVGVGRIPYIWKSMIVISKLDRDLR